MVLLPPALFKKGEEGRKKKEVLLHTHTPGRAGETLKGKRKKKADTRRADGQKQRRGGRGTDGPPEPTYTAKRTWQKQSTHLNPTTHYGEARRRVIRDQWGLVGEKNGNNKIVKQDSVPKKPKGRALFPCRDRGQVLPQLA